MWNNILVEPDKTYFWSVGGKEIYVNKNAKEWMFSIKESTDQSTPSIFGDIKNSPEEAVWSTFVDDKKSSLLVLPALPDRPLVIRPTTTLKIMPKKSLLLFVQVPVWLQFYSESPKKEKLITDINSRELSSTWFGDKEKGTLAYRLDLNIPAALERPEKSTHHVVCPVQLINTSAEKLDIQRLLLNCENLNVYFNGNELWANELKIRFKGEHETSEVQNVDTAPSYITKSRLINPARVSKSKNMMLKSFHFIKSFTNY